MKRTIGNAASLLLVSILAAPGAFAATRLEHQLQLTHPAPVSSETSNQTTGAGQTAQKAETSQRYPFNPAIEKKAVQLSERDRLILERQQQRIIPSAQ